MLKEASNKSPEKKEVGLVDGRIISNAVLCRIRVFLMGKGESDVLHVIYAPPPVR